MFSRADGTFPNSLFRPDQKNVHWVHIITATVVDDDAGQNLTVSFTHEAMTDANPVPIGRRVRVFPALVVDNFERAEKWKIGDLLRFKDPDPTAASMFDVKLFGLNDVNRRILVDRPIVSSTFDNGAQPRLANQLSARTEIRNLYAAQGGMSIPLFQSGDEVNGVKGDFNNAFQDSPSSGHGEATALARGNLARSFLRIDYIPKDLDLKDGDIIRIKNIESGVRQDGNTDYIFSGQFRVHTDGALGESATYQKRDNHDGEQTLAEMQVSEQSNVAVKYVENASGTQHYTRLAQHNGIAVVGGQAWDGNIVFTNFYNETSQISHVGGRVAIYLDSQHTRAKPVKFITAKYRGTPYVQAEAVQMDPTFIQSKYSFPYMENEIYRRRVNFDWDAGTHKVRVRMPQITLLQGFSTMFIYAPIHPDKRRLEFYTGFSDFFFDISSVSVRVNEKMCIKGTEPESFFYDEFQRVSEKKYTLDQWRHRKVIALTPETLAYPGLFESAKRLYNLSVEFDVSVSRRQSVLMENAPDLFSTLSTSDHPISQLTRHNEAAANFIRKLSAEARVVIEYTRKRVTLSEEGDLKIQHELVPTEQPDGLTLRGNTQQASVMRTGGDPTAFLASF